MPDHVFVGGLHRSGTTLLTHALASHPETSSFTATGFPEDEGQFLQRVYPIAKIYGGPGKFGFDPRAHLTESSPLASAECQARLRAEWEQHWDLSKRVLIEKSPPNLLKLRFLQRMFPAATFVVVMRHPIAVAMATEKWSLTSMRSLLRHWLTCHEIFLADAPSIQRLILVQYESLVAEADLIARLQSQLGLAPAEDGIARRAGVNAKYFRAWSKGGPSGSLQATLARRYERRANRFGYSLTDPEQPVASAPEVRRLLLASA